MYLLNRILRVSMPGITIIALAVAMAASGEDVPNAPVGASSEWAGVENDEEKERQRREWFEGQRAYPALSVPRGAKLRAWQALEKSKKAKKSLAVAPAAENFAAAGPWVNVGPAPQLIWSGLAYSNRIEHLAADPGNSSHWLISAPFGGLWETFDAGATWTPRTDDMPSLATGAVAFSPSNPLVVYSGIGEPGVGGLLKSLDGGTSWQLIATSVFSAGDTFAEIRVSPADPAVLYAATHSFFGNASTGIWKSTDGGSHWTHQLTGRALVLATNPDNINQQYTILGGGFAYPEDGVYRYDGTSWTRLTGPWGTLAGNAGFLAIAPSDANVVYVNIVGTGIWKTANAWAATPIWTKIPDPPFHDFGAFVVDRTDPKVLWGGGVSFYKFDGQYSTTSTTPTLHGRKPVTPGGTDYQAYYDDVLNITWLANANLAATNTFGVTGINPDGTMNWAEANAWIAAMNTANFLGVSGWRLPSIIDTGTPGCAAIAYSGTDCGYNVQTKSGDTIYSELAHLYYVTLGNIGWFNASGVDNGCSPSCRTNDGPFSSLPQFAAYWSGTEYAPDTSQAWRFGVHSGYQVNAPKTSDLYAWAVLPGDIAWTDLTRADQINGLHVDLRYIDWAGTRLLLGNDGGVFSSLDGGAHWLDHNTNLSITQFYAGSLHPTNPNIAMGGTQDDGTARWTGTNTWGTTTWGDGMASVFSVSSPDTSWATSVYNLYMYRTLDGGTTYWSIDGGIDPLGRPFFGMFDKCPANENIVIAGSHALWKSTDFFTAAAPSWSLNGPEMNDPISAVAFAPSSSSCQIYAYGNNNSLLRLTTNGGAGWVDLDPAGAVPARYVTDLAFNPANPSTLYVTLSGYDENTPGQPGHLFRTTNASSPTPTWVNISPPNSNLPFDTVVLDPLNPSSIYVGTDLGIWHSPDGGTNWAHMGPEVGVPNTIVNGLQFNQATNTLMAFTYGRGALLLAGASNDAEADGVPNALDNCTLKANPTQCDSNGDGYGNHCDGDLDNNGFTNAFDTPLFRAQLGQPSVGPTYNQADLNCNGFVNAFDTPLFRSLLGTPPGPSGLEP